MKSLIIAILICLQVSESREQDFIGVGHNSNLNITTSSGNGDVTGDGFGIQNTPLLYDASRFLTHATLGYDWENIEAVAAIGYENWIDEQFRIAEKSQTEYVFKYLEYWEDDEEKSEYFESMSVRSAWMNNVIKDSDLLRQKITYALSQILVVSRSGSDIFEDYLELSTRYYDILNKNAFGNYRDILHDVSLSPSMGIYLSHLNNPKADPENNIHPDENYAREIMQLFSIGLFELNNDGSLKYDNEGKIIPTYTNKDIKEFAKIFTGFGYGYPGAWFGGHEEEFDDYEFAKYPMKMFEEWHQQGEKKLLNGFVVPDGQTGMKDFNDAIDNLFNHPNVGPFISRALIQLLVTANPSPAYINRVSNKFNDDGNGVRGDMKAVIKAILLDPEARNCDPTNEFALGKLREPIHRYISYLKAFKFKSVGYNDAILVELGDFEETVGQVPQHAPSVFNFYSPNYQAQGAIKDNDLYSPVFQIHNSSTSIGYLNLAFIWALELIPVLEIEEIEEVFNIRYEMDFSDEMNLRSQPSKLVERLNILLACGQLSEESKEIISNSISQIEEEDRFNMALYLVLISPEFAVIK